MRKILYTALALVLVATAYVGSPFFTAWSIRDAIQRGNAAYLERKIEWDTVRSTLRESLVRATFDRPAADVILGETGAEKPGLWQRIKARIGQRALDGFVASYVTPEGLSQLFQYRKAYRQAVSAEPDPSTLAWHHRLAAFWARVKRAEFRTATEFEIEMADRNDPSRTFVGLLRLRGFEWKLSELRIKQAGQAEAATAAPGAAG